MEAAQSPRLPCLGRRGVHCGHVSCLPLSPASGRVLLCVLGFALDGQKTEEAQSCLERTGARPPSEFMGVTSARGEWTGGFSTCRLGRPGGLDWNTVEKARDLEVELASGSVLLVGWPSLASASGVHREAPAVSGTRPAGSPGEVPAGGGTGHGQSPLGSSGTVGGEGPESWHPAQRVSPTPGPRGLHQGRGAGWGWGSVPPVPDPVSDGPLLARTPLHHQPQPEVGVFGHFHLQAPASVPAHDGTTLWGGGPGQHGRPGLPS